MEEDNLLTLTADIVSAHVSNNSVSSGDLAGLIQKVHGALSALSRPAASAAEPIRREPVVTVRSSVRPDAIACLLCGKRQKTLKRHLMAAHGMTPDDYRSEFGLKSDYPMVARDYAEQRRSLAVSIGLGRKKEVAPSKRGGRSSKSGG